PAGSPEDSIERVRRPYRVVGAALVRVAGLLRRSSVPNDGQLHAAIPAGVPEADQEGSRRSALAYPQLVMGMSAIFLYVGVEVSTIDNLPAYLEQPLSTGGLGLETSVLAPFVPLSWASLMTGRWGGAAGPVAVRAGAWQLLVRVLAFVAFA
ncbi:MFS transporter, partial [Stenotrophomonas sp. MB339]